MRRRPIFRAFTFILLASAMLTGCRGCVRESVVYEHTFNRPDFRWRGGTPPPDYPEYELPPAHGASRGKSDGDPRRNYLTVR